VCRNKNNCVEAGQKSQATRQLRAGAVALMRSTCKHPTDELTELIRRRASQ
jgi:hypothetical protein